MSKSEHIENFFEYGRIQLGSFLYYRKFDNEEIGDNSEGAVIVVGRNSLQTAFAEIGSGFNNYVFCCYDGLPKKQNNSRIWIRFIFRN